MKAGDLSMLIDLISDGVPWWARRFASEGDRGGSIHAPSCSDPRRFTSEDHAPSRSRIHSQTRSSSTACGLTECPSFVEWFTVAAQMILKTFGIVQVGHVTDLFCCGWLSSNAMGLRISCSLCYFD